MDNVRFLYLRNVRGNAFACLAVSLDRKNNSISYGLSTCNPHDKFDKSLAKRIASSRLDKQPSVIEYVRLADITCHEITRHVMYTVMNDRPVFDHEGAPQKVRIAARLWLSKYVKVKPSKSVKKTVKKAAKRKAA
jgi:hypothetical protein